MRFKRRILVAISGSQEQPEVIEKARLIASRLNAELFLMLTSRRLATEGQLRLQEARQALEASGLRVSLRRRQRAELLEDLVFAAQELDCGLLIKAPDQPRGLTDLLLPPRDWKLLRYAPCPVLMVKQQQAWRGRRLLAAVNMAPDSPAHHALNRQILALVETIAELAQSPWSLVTAYPSVMLSGGSQPQSIKAQAAACRQRAGELCEELGVQPDEWVVEEGPAETLIPREAERAALVVLGTVARRGLNAALLGGNTAEAILSRLHCDVLTVQPAGSDQVLDLLRQSAGDGTDGSAG